jgi:hypothetical protein
VWNKGERPIGPEELTDPEFGGGRHHYTWMYGFPRIAVREMASGARPVSQIVDTDGEFLYHGAVLYENALGGRVVTFPHFCDASVPDVKGPQGVFYSPYRRQQFHALMAWLNRGPVPLLVHSRGWTLPHRADGSGRIGLAVMNITSDTWNGIRMDCAAESRVRGVEWLDIGGAKHKLDGSMWRQEERRVTLTLDVRIPPLRTVACLLETE